MAIFSIITVVYNGVELIENTIQSVISQSKREQLQYIIIDGNSDDGTREQILKYEHDIDIFISENDRGIYDAMNKGLALATGDFLLFLNAGDELSTDDLIERLIPLSQDADILYGETNYINEHREVIGTRTHLTTRKLPEQLVKNSFKKGMVVCHQSFIVRRSIAPIYDLQYSCSADIDWCLHCIEKSSMNINTALIIANYLVDGYSITNQKTCWKERWKIYNKHYGIIESALSHIFIILRAIKFKFKKHSA